MKRFIPKNIDYILYTVVTPGLLRFAFKKSVTVREILLFLVVRQTN